MRYECVAFERWLKVKTTLVFLLAMELHKGLFEFPKEIRGGRNANYQSIDKTRS